jgi:chemotaxis family two-component system response regulator Rcp1
MSIHMSPKAADHIEILLVDDDEADVLLTTQMLKRGKLLLEVKVANDGEEALELLKGLVERDESLPDIILLDINMPRLNGFETLKRLRAQETLKSVPVVMLTTSDAPQDVKRVYELGANCYISKPVTFEQFQKVITLLKEFWFTVVKLPKAP